MRGATIALLTLLGCSSAHAESDCQALAERISAGFKAAHGMSSADKTAKCHAYAMVTFDMTGIGNVCQKPDDMKVVNETIKPVAKALKADEQEYCKR